MLQVQWHLIIERCAHLRVPSLQELRLMSLNFKRSFCVKTKKSTTKNTLLTWPDWLQMEGRSWLGPPWKHGTSTSLRVRAPETLIAFWNLWYQKSTHDVQKQNCCAKSESTSRCLRKSLTPRQIVLWRVLWWSGSNWHQQIDGCSKFSLLEQVGRSNQCHDCKKKYLCHTRFEKWNVWWPFNFYRASC